MWTRLYTVVSQIKFNSRLFHSLFKSLRGKIPNYSWNWISGNFLKISRISHSSCSHTDFVPIQIVYRMRKNIRLFVSDDLIWYFIFVTKALINIACEQAIINTTSILNQSCLFWKPNLVPRACDPREEKWGSWDNPPSWFPNPTGCEPVRLNLHEVLDGFATCSTEMSWQNNKYLNCYSVVVHLFRTERILDKLWSTDY